MSRSQVRLHADGSGDQVITLAKVKGEIMGIELEIGTLGAPTITFEDATTGEDFLTEVTPTVDSVYRPRAPIQTTAGVDVAYAAGPPVVDALFGPLICYGGLTITIADADAGGRGSVYVVTD